MAVQDVRGHTRRTGRQVAAYTRLTPGSPRPRRASLAGAPKPSDQFTQPHPAGR
jgi:hypothetical protein